jgi:hypothetical protein
MAPAGIGIVTGAVKFSAKFGRKCDRCGFRVRPGHALYRLTETGEIICHVCAWREATHGR